MIYGLFSDIHSNLAALEAVLASMSMYKVERKVCLGDLVGYCADADTCVQLVQAHSDICLMGNHDSVALHREPSIHFNQFARLAIEWTQKHLSKESLDYMKKLPYIVEEGELCFVHASPKSPADWYYVSSLEDAVDAFEYFSSRICFVGHTHSPVIVTLGHDNVPRVVEEESYVAKEGERLLVNVGSVGQPRDRNPQACWCYFDSETFDIRFVRVPYAVHKTQETMRQNQFPPFLVQRIAEGR